MKKIVRHACIVTKDKKNCDEIKVTGMKKFR